MSDRAHPNCQNNETLNKLDHCEQTVARALSHASSEPQRGNGSMFADQFAMISAPTRTLIAALVRPVAATSSTYRSTVNLVKRENLRCLEGGLLTPRVLEQIDITFSSQCN